MRLWRNLLVAERFIVRFIASGKRWMMPYNAVEVQFKGTRSESAGYRMAVEGRRCYRSHLAYPFQFFGWNFEP